MRDLIGKNINGSKVLLLFILTNIVYAIMLTITIPEVMNCSGGIKLLDMMPTGYNAGYVNSLLNALGEKGRHDYLFKQIPVDMIYPCLFGISYCLLLAYFLQKIGKFEKHYLYLCYLPLLAGFFDYAENIGIVGMLSEYPNNSALLSRTTNVFTILKSIFTAASLMLLIFILIVFGINKLIKRAL